MDTLKAYIREGEHQQQDFKFRIDDAKKIARTLSAFANTDGGRLLIGVKDNGKVVGIHPEEEFHMIQGAAEMYCKPAISFESNVWQDKHKLVLEVLIEPADEKPIKSLDENGVWKTYIRRDDHTLLANKILIGLWKQKKRNHAKPEKFDEEELSFLRTIKEEAPATLSRLYRKSDLPKKRVDNLLILFISWDLVAMDISEEGTFYRLK
ncbi:ATP-binding protein [Lishizhenia sp.]|uniref:AlbA family DNA-binding domain-containing protein n=1 Tax=Lishizhenia sp. TaxID=2497594 RepID=UPI00299DE03E|nr:ATP-binding protein [Lishizhenia sp.]MDX1446614.1 ATP-binding protein [Lishizhenia sp.]